RCRRSIRAVFCGPPIGGGLENTPRTRPGWMNMGKLAESPIESAAPGVANRAARRQIWLCADDYGISAAVNTAIRDLVVRGRINATSVLVTAPSFHRSEAKALDVLNAGNPRVAIGLHVTLSAPFRPLSQGFTPLHNGSFLSLGMLLIHAL